MRMCFFLGGGWLSTVSSLSGPRSCGRARFGDRDFGLAFGHYGEGREREKGSRPLNRIGDRIVWPIWDFQRMNYCEVIVLRDLYRCQESITCEQYISQAGCKYF